MQTPTPYEQREHQLCFFFIQLNRQVSSVRKKSQCAFYVVICLPAPRANETKVVFFLKKTKSALPFCLSLSTKPHDSPIKYSYWYTSLLILLSPPVLPVAFCAATLSSFRATTRNPGIPARYNSGHTSRASLLHLLPPPEAGPRIGVRVTLSSFRAATRNPEIPARDYANKSSACTLWTPHRVRGDICASRVSNPLGHSAPRRGIQKYRQDITQDTRAVRHYSTHCHLQKLDPASGTGRHSRSFRAATRNPEIPARYNSGRTSRASLLLPLPPPEARPRIGVRVTHYIHSSLQREERTKKRRRCYRAISFGGWRRPRGCGTRCAQTVLALTPRSAGLLPAR